MNHSASPLSGQEPLEIERKFLIEYPDPAWLEQQPGSRRVEIVQTYLLSDGSGSRRVRSWTESGRTTLYASRAASNATVSGSTCPPATSRKAFPIRSHWIRNGVPSPHPVN